MLYTKEKYIVDSHEGKDVKSVEHRQADHP
jgi:hypothetical protein